MDPLSVLSLVAAVAQFTDLGLSLMTGTKDFWTNAKNQRVNLHELAELAKTLKELSEEVEQKSALINMEAAGQSSMGAALRRQCGECILAAQDLLDMEERLRVRFEETDGVQKRRNPLKGAFVDAFKAIDAARNEPFINNLRNRISRIRQEMMMTSIMILWEQSGSGAVYLHTIAEQQTAMSISIQEIKECAKRLDTILPCIIQGSPVNIGRDQENVMDFIWTPDFSHLWGYHTTTSLGQDNSTTFGIEYHRQLAIMNSLAFEGAKYRQEKIPLAYTKTFEWIFKESRPMTTVSPGRTLWSSVSEWLAGSSQRIYWITGKPGSGKSTLMKFVAENEKTQKYLNDWCQKRRLLLATFYSWNSGNEMQKSQEGLLRTLLYQCMTQMPELIPKIVPKRWAMLTLFGKDAMGRLPLWTWNELQESFSALRLLCGTNLYLAIFIDGLDEFDGDHSNLINLIDSFCGQEGVKVCVSSRPENVFIDQLSGNPNLKLEDLTKSDIETFVRGKLNSNRGFQELSDGFPAEALQLVGDIVKKAHGVFLWVDIVVASLLEGLTEGDDLCDLKKTLEELPSDLEDLFQRMWLRIKPKYVPQSSRIFQIHRAAATGLSAVTLFLADDKYSLDFDINEMTPTRATQVIQLMKRRINSRTKGLLEISLEGHVDYLHRTVKDWVAIYWTTICSEAPPDFDPNLMLLKALVVELYETDYWQRRVSNIVCEVKAKQSEAYNYITRVKKSPRNSHLLLQLTERLESELLVIGQHYGVMIQQTNSINVEQRGT